MDNRSIFQKFGGIRPMAGKIGAPSSTVKSWHTKGQIPRWWHSEISACAFRHGIDLCADEIVNIRPDAADGKQKAAA